MRGSVRRLGSLLLPALQAGRGTARAQATARWVPAAPHSWEDLKVLQLSIKFEAGNKFANTQGSSAPFDVFLQKALESLHQGGRLPPSIASNILQQAQNYRSMPVEQRQHFCSNLQELLNSIRSGASSAVGASYPPYTSSRGRTGRYAARAVHVQPATVEQQSAAPPPTLPAVHMPLPGTQLGAAPPSIAEQGADSTVNGSETAGPAAWMAVPAAPTQSTISGSTAADQPRGGGGAGLTAAAEAALSQSIINEWDLSIEQQQQQPFWPPDPAALLRPVPIIFDLETSGRGSKARVAEFGAMAVASGDTFQAYVSLPPGVEMEPLATSVTGLTTEFLAQHEPFEQVYPLFVSFLRRQVEAAAPGSYLVLVGHNIRAFDLPVLRTQAPLSGLPILRHARFLDTYPLARAVFPRTGDIGQPDNWKLEGLYTHFASRQPNRSHRALEDCMSNAVVLEKLLQRLVPQPPDGGIEALVHAAAWQTNASWCGWVNNVGTEQRAKPATKRRKLISPTSPTNKSASLVDVLAADAMVAVEEQQEWDVEDPVMEAELQAGSSSSTVQNRRAHVQALQQGWHAVQQDSQLQASFLTTPISELKRFCGGFTAKQQAHLQASGIATLGQLLDCYPSRLITSQPGRLPQESDQNPVVTLAVRCTKKPILKKVTVGYFLKAEFEVVHPSEGGLDAAWPPPDAYDGSTCTLQVYEFRKIWNSNPQRTKWALLSMAEELEAVDGEVLVLSGPVRLQPVGPFAGPDTWRFDANKWKVLRLEKARSAFCQPQSSVQLQVVHPSKTDIPPKTMASLVDKALRAAEEAEAKGQFHDPLPAWMRERYQLQSLLPALRGVHMPGSEEELEEARQRLAFQELLALQLKLLVQRNMAWAGTGGGGVRVGNSLLLELTSEALPYELTGGQQGALDSILRQMESWPPMQCLLQGDVGCGKTAVAFMALLAAVGSGYQGAIMAPTEILADQHYNNLQALVQAINRLAGKRGEANFRLPRITLVTGTVRGKARLLVDEALASGAVDIAVGTHALISDSTQFARLGLAIVDEQHKFGVEQRGRLLAKASPSPHVLHMTATPIPRTQALIDHGNMTQVLIQELPAGRSPVQTHTLQDNSPERLQMYEHIRQEMGQGHGIYIVCPFVETSDNMAEVKAATSELDRLVEEGVFERQDCGLLHGQMPSEQKDAVLQQFKEGAVKVLVSTTVVEVGVDVPQATVMVIEHAERFGFAQLHQLRGRVGRSHRKSFCYLVYSADAGPSVKKKMKVLVNCSNGFTVAECDLELRGAGEVLGRRQSGRDIKTSFKVAQIPADRDLLEQARQAASILLQREPDPRQWPAELRSLLVDENMLQLDTLTVPNLS